MTTEIKKEEETKKVQPKEKFSLKNTWNQKKDDVLALVGKWTHQKSDPKK
jgi:hypothetical protein